MMTITAILVLLSWLYVGFCWWKRTNLSTSYGILSIVYLIHAFALRLEGQPIVFYVIFSILWMFFYAAFKKIENISSKNDINKKDKDNYG